MTLEHGYKLFRYRKNGTLGPLFINRKQILQLNTWYTAEDIPTKGYAHRPGWHITDKPYAPHLSMKDRVWAKVMFMDFEFIQRPKSQGGLWYIAKQMKILELLRTPLCQVQENPVTLE